MNNKNRLNSEERVNFVNKDDFYILKSKVFFNYFVNKNKRKLNFKIPCLSDC